MGPALQFLVTPNDIQTTEILETNRNVAKLRIQFWS